MLSTKTFLKRFYFGEHISRKHGQKCCPYGQNGKPLSPEKVEEFMQTYKIKPPNYWTTND